MKELLRLVQCEYIKMKRSKFFLAGGLGTLIVPFFVIVRAVVNYYSGSGAAVSLFSLYDNVLMFLMLLFAPMVLTVLGAWTLSREYTEGLLKNIFVIPVSKTAFLIGKLVFFATVALAFMIVSWLEILAAAFLCSFFIPVTELTVPSCLFFLAKMLFGGILLCATQMPFLYLAIRSKGFAAPIIAVCAVSLINVVLSNSGIAGFYPWSASYLLVSGRMLGAGCSKEVSAGIIFMMFLVSVSAGLVRFQKEEV